MYGYIYKFAAIENRKQPIAINCWLRIAVPRKGLLFGSTSNRLCVRLGGGHRFLSHEKTTVSVDLNSLSHGLGLHCDKDEMWLLVMKFRKPVMSWPASIPIPVCVCDMNQNNPEYERIRVGSEKWKWHWCPDGWRFRQIGMRPKRTIILEHFETQYCNSTAFRRNPTGVKPKCSL